MCTDEQLPTTTRLRRTKAAAERRSCDVVKREFDVCVSGIGPIVAAPVLAGAVIVLLGHGRPMLFRRLRHGRRGKFFEILKFRTMLQPDDDHVTDKQRLTGLGRFLRSSSLDGLLSLWNVVRGEMSFVGRQPVRVEYRCRYTPGQSWPLVALPGGTGLAQICGRNDLDWDDKFRLTGEYVSTRCLRVDRRILLQTVWDEVREKGINKSEFDTVPIFTGEEDTGDGCS